jgi:hypothetical protein
MGSQSEVKVDIPGIVVTSLDEKMVYDGIRDHGQEGMVVIPLDDVVGTTSEPPELAHHPIFSKDPYDGTVMIRVAPDEQPPPQEINIGAIGTSGEVRLAIQNGVSSRTFSPPPEVVTLPFNVSTADHADAEQDKSSAVACVDEEVHPPSRKGSKRESLAKRLSVGSANIMRNLSQRSKTNTIGSYDEAHGESREELMDSRQSRRYDDADSLAAHIDDLSSDDGRDFLDEEKSEQIPDEPSTPGRQNEIEKRRSEERSTQDWLTPTKSRTVPYRTSAADTVSTLPLSITEVDCAGSSHLAERAVPGQGDVTDRSLDEDPARPDRSDTTSMMAKPFVSAGPSQPLVLKPEHLPQPLSRVALSYRTNEWAKHLSHADAPEPEDLRLNQSFAETAQPVVEEPAPVNVEELQKTADNAPRPAAAPRMASAMSNHGASLPSMSRNVSTGSLTQRERNISPLGPHVRPQVRKDKSHRTSAQLVTRPITVEGNSKSYSLPSLAGLDENLHQGAKSHSAASSPSIPDQDLASASTPNLLNRPPVPGMVSYSSPQTLMGKRELLLRNKSQPSLYGAEPGNLSNNNLSTIHSRSSSEAGSVRDYPVLGTDLSTSTNSLTHPRNLDNLPLSQRREILRQASLNILEGSRVPISPILQSRRSTTQSYIPLAVQQTRLANFRSTVQSDLTNGAAFASPYGTNANLSHVSIGGREVDVRRAVEQQRNTLLLQKEAEARAKEKQRIQRLREEREFEERMRRGELLGAHREAMRRLQGGVKDL